MKPLTYNHGGRVYQFLPGVLNYFDAARQTRGLSKETGGQLFARFNGSSVLIEAATEVRGKSRRSRFSFWPDRDTEQREIHAQFDRGLHYVGDWHTHPEQEPWPSMADEEKMRDIFRKSDHELDAMVLAIVGLAPFARGLYVGAATGTGVIHLPALL